MRYTVTRWLVCEAAISFSPFSRFAALGARLEVNVSQAPNVRVEAAPNAHVIAPECRRDGSQRC